MVPLMIAFAAILLGGPVFPWWWPAVPGILIGFWMPHRPVRAFFATAAGAGAAWLVLALWYDMRNDGLLSGRVAPLFHLPGTGGLLAAAACMGAATAALGALFGIRFRRFWASLHDALAEVATPVPPEDDGRVPPPRTP